MNKDTAKDYLPLVQALAEGKTIQRYNKNDGWEDVSNPQFDKQSSDYRIKPESKNGWYRVAVFNNRGFNPIAIVIYEFQEHECELAEGFVRWLTDRIEYTLPEGDA